MFTKPKTKTQISGVTVYLLFFRNIYLGETFMSYVCLHNDSGEVCDHVVLRFNFISSLTRQLRLEFRTRYDFKWPMALGLRSRPFKLGMLS